MGSNNGVPTQQKQDHGKEKERKSEKEKKGKKTAVVHSFISICNQLRMLFPVIYNQSTYNRHYYTWFAQIDDGSPMECGVGDRILIIGLSAVAVLHRLETLWFRSEWYIHIHPYFLVALWLAGCSISIEDLEQNVIVRELSSSLPLSPCLPSSPPPHLPTSSALRRGQGCLVSSK